MALSRDGELLASAGSDNSIRVWSVNSGRLIHVFKSHKDMVWQLAFSPDGKRLASAGYDHKVRVRDLTSGSELYVLDAPARPGYFEPPREIAFSPDGNRLAACNCERAVARDVPLRVWDLNTGKLLYKLPGAANVHQFAFASDGRTLVGDNGRAFVIWDLASGEVRRMVAHARMSGPFAIQPDGIWLAGAVEGAVEVWDAGTGEVVKSLPADTSVSAVAFGAAGEVIAGGTGKLLVWDQWQRRPDVKWGGGRVVRITVAGQSLLVCDDAALSQVVQLVGSGEAHTLGTRELDARSLTLDRDGVLVAGYDSFAQTIHLFSARSGALLRDITGSVQSLYDLTLSDDNRTLAWAGSGRRGYVWDLETGSMRSVPDLPNEDASMRLHLDAAGRRLFVTGELWVSVVDAETGRLLHRLGPHKTRVLATAVSPDGKTLATGDFGREVRLWDVDSGWQKSALAGHTGAVGALSWSPDGSRLASGSGDHTIRLWDGGTGRPLATLSGHREGITWLEFGRGGRRLLSYAGEQATPGNIAGKQDRAIVWDATTGNVVAELEAGAQTAWLGMSPDGNKVAIAEKNQLTVHDLTTGTHVTAEAHDDRVYCLDWSPDGRFLASGGRDAMVKIWRAADLSPFRSLDWHAAEIRRLRFSSDGRELYSASIDGEVSLWNVEQQTRVSILADGWDWVSYTDDGFFDASGSGADLVSAVLGARAFAIDQLALGRNRPERVLGRIRPVPEELVRHFNAVFQERIKKAGIGEPNVNSALLPRARIRRVEDSSAGKVVVEAELDADEGIRGYQIYVNDVPLHPGGKSLPGQTHQVVREEIELARGVNQIEIASFGLRGQESMRDLVVRNRADGPRGSLYFLGFGLSKYRHGLSNLTFADADALELADHFRQRHDTPLFDSIKVKTFVNEQVTRSNIEEARRWLATATPHDALVVFVAGHGVRDTTALATYYYLLHDTELDQLARTALPFGDLERLLYDGLPRRKLLLLDTCQSGDDIDLNARVLDSGPRQDDGSIVPRALRNLTPAAAGAPGGARAYLRDTNRFIYRDLARRSGAIVFAASLGREVALESPAWGHGAFTREVLDALRSPAADLDGNGSLSSDELRRWVETRVPVLTAGRQHPTVDKDNLFLKLELPMAGR